MTLIKPVRIQLSRKKGFYLQNVSYDINGLSAVSVARGRNQKWGNPFIIGEYVSRGPHNHSAKSTLVKDKAEAAEAFGRMLYMRERNYPPKAEIIEALKGKNLACWCGPNEACHADILLKYIAEQEKYCE